jgi:hypothetical protein
VVVFCFLWEFVLGVGVKGVELLGWIFHLMDFYSVECYCRWFYVPCNEPGSFLF